MLRGAPTMMLIVDLCVATCFFNHWPQNDIFCPAFAYLMYVALTAECIILMNITIGQYLVIVHRVSNKTCLHHHKHLRLCSLLGLPWLVTMAIYLLPLTQIWDKFGYDPKKGYCSLLSVGTGAGFLTIGAITLTSTMTLITFYCYAAIFLVQFTSRRKINPDLQMDSARGKGQTRNIQLIRIITAILINYTVTYLPFLITSIVDPCQVKTSESLYSAVIYVSWSHVATNPLIYALLNTRINAMICSGRLPCKSSQSTEVSRKVTDGIDDRDNEINTTV
ncbi:unnamed protein product [Candidula unifasciata]|uniref:G-protein coupled receptors family 1 profile domain-containing protein n=1 Tax=Candidula unifasciata TaxID=100452 RepID=A0A8S3YCS6_9EUPU|nr:unnamed protein product [Candidula unifasciata]